MNRLKPFSMTVGCLAVVAVASAAEPLAPLPAGVRLLSDVAYLPADRTEKLDIYLPPVSTGAGDRADVRRPAVIYYHGGGWVRGDKATERERNIGGKLAAAGYVFVSVNYVLGPRAWPANLLDCKNAVRFVRQHAARYGIDPDRIAAMGTSAGGHLAMMVGYTTDHAEFEPTAPYAGVSSRVAAVVDFYGMTNLLTRRQVESDGTPTGQFMDSHAPEVLGVTRTENPARWRAASPVTHVTKNSPPTLIVHGLADATVDYIQAVELANVLRARGVAHELRLLEGIGHMFYLDDWKGQPMPDLTPVVTAFLAKYLSRAPLAAAKE